MSFISKACLLSTLLLALACVAAPASAETSTELPNKLTATGKASADPIRDALGEARASIKAEAPSLAASAPAPEKLKESEIPVTIGEKLEKKTESDPLRRAVWAFAALAVALGAGAYALKKVGKKSAGGKQNARIQILAQHYLGPKKSIAIVHVAGESMLLGITENNINLIKSLSLIDDEVPASLPNTFDSAMDGYDPAPEADREELADDNFAVRGLSEIRDIVSSGRFGRGSSGSRKR